MERIKKKLKPATNKLPHGNDFGRFITILATPVTILSEICCDIISKQKTLQATMRPKVAKHLPGTVI